MTTFRGTVTARAFVIDVGVIGEQEARTRVLGLWQPGARVHAMPTGSWLVVLAEPVEVRAERAPGLPLTEVPEGLEPLDCALWTDTSGLARHELTLADLAPAPEPVESAVPERPQLRVRGGIGRPSKQAEKLLGQEGSATLRAVLIVVGAISVPVLLLVALSAMAAGNTKPILVIVFTATIAAMWTARRGAVGTAERAPGREPGNLWVRLIMRTPFRALVRTRHDRYLRRLTE
ncbi:MAG: hypothetical protein HOV94_05140, partial [Saccharothrix sp.]|nr:hypothetical protein [Saccharothrix sp.]